MPGLKIGVNLSSLRLPFRKALVAAARLGAQAVEIDAQGELSPQELSQSGVRELRKMLDDLHLTVCALAYRTRRGYSDTVDLESRVEGTKAAMRLAYDLRAPIVVNHIGRVPADEKSEAWRVLVNVLGDLGRHAARAGAWLAAETGSESGDDMARLLAALPEHAIAIDLNPGRLVAGGFDPLEAVAVLGKAIAHVHAADAARDAVGGPADTAALGRGAADFPALLGALYEQGYRGYFTVQAQSADEPLREIGDAIEYLRRL